MPDLARMHNLAGELRKHAKPKASTRKGNWYDIRNAASAKAEVYLYDMIGEDFWGGGINARDFADELRSIGAPVIELHINSEGGEVFDGIAIYECLKQHPARIEVMVDSLAASAASFIAMAGDSVKMARNARMMIHDAAIGGAMGSGNAKDMREFAAEVGKLADLLDEMSLNIADIYAQRAGGAAEDWRVKMLAETWFSATQAKDAGLIDEVMGEEGSTTPVESTTAEDAIDTTALLAALKGAWDA